MKCFGLVILSLTVLLSAGLAQAASFHCANNEDYRKQSVDTKWAWTFSQLPKESIQGVAIVVHGLNTSPKRMVGLRQLFSEKNFEVLNVTLSGHGGNLEAWKTTSRQVWLHDLYGGYCVAQAKAKALGVPLYYVGYSLGGLLGVDLLSDPSFADVSYDKMVLIAPALAVNWTSHLVRVFNLFTERFILPSANSESYRANKKGTSIAAYNALFSSLKHIQARNLSQFNIPSLLMVDPKDELVNSDGLLDLIRSQHLTNWDLHIINNDGSYLDTSYHHLMIDYGSMGQENWDLMKTRILDFIP